MRLQCLQSISVEFVGTCIDSCKLSCRVKLKYHTLLKRRGFNIVFHLTYVNKVRLEIICIMLINQDSWLNGVIKQRIYTTANEMKFGNPNKSYKGLDNSRSRKRQKLSLHWYMRIKKKGHNPPQHICHAHLLFTYMMWRTRFI